MADWRKMTDDERYACAAITPGKVSYPVASAPKRLARSLAGQAAYPNPQITDKQAACLWRLVYRFRRQLPDYIVKMATDRGQPEPKPPQQ